MYSSQTTLQTGVHNNAKQEHKTNHPREQRREHAERKQRHGGNEPSVRPESGQPRKAAEPEQKKVNFSFFSRQIRQHSGGLPLVYHKEAFMLRKDYDYTQEQLYDYANQNNPNNEEYWHSRGLDYQNPDLED